MNAPASSIDHEMVFAGMSPRARAEAERRLAKAQPYKLGDLHVLHDTGVITMRPQGVRVLLRAILQEDADLLGVGVEYDARKAIAHEVLDVGPGVEHWLDTHGVPDEARDSRGLWRRIRTWFSGRGVREFARPRVGDHIFLLSTAADRASKTDKSCRIWYAHCEDISGAWTVS